MKQLYYSIDYGPLNAYYNYVNMEEYTAANMILSELKVRYPDYYIIQVYNSCGVVLSTSIK